MHDYPSWRRHLGLKIAGSVSFVAIVISFAVVFPTFLLWLWWLMLTALAVAALGVLLFGLDKLHVIVTRMWERHIDTQIKRVGRDRERQRLVLELQHQRLQIERAIKERSRQKQVLLPVRYTHSSYRALPAPGQTYQPVRGSQRYTRVEEVPRELPAYIAYEDIRLRPGQFVLGVNAQLQVAHCPFDQLMTMWVVGGSDTGKTNTIALKVHEAIQNGRNIKIILIDPHKRKPDSLWNRLRCYEQELLFVAQTSEEIYEALVWFKNEYDARQEMDTEDLREVDDLLLICDEVKRVMASDDEQIGKLLKRIVEICGYESRGFGMFGWFISQQAAGLKWLRDAVMTTIVHKMHTMEERVLALNGNQKLAHEMDSWSGKGRVVVYGQNFNGFFVLQMPDFHLPASEGPSSLRLASAAPRPRASVPPPVPEPKPDIMEVGKQVYLAGATSLDKFAAAMTAAGVQMSREQARTWKPRVEIALRQEQEVG
jgi:hypothetical protein